MNNQEIFSKICEMERWYGEDFYDLGGGSIELSSRINNLECLAFLKETRPAIYKHICKAAGELIVQDIDEMVEMKNPRLNIYDHDYFFVFSNDIEDKKIYEELKDFTYDGTAYKCDDGELWKMVIVILSEGFPEIKSFLLETFEEEDI